MKNKIYATASIFASSLLLAACGGGGGGDNNSSSTSATPTTSTPTTVASAQGVYEGNLSNGSRHQTIILDDDRYYTMYGQNQNGTFYVYGMVQGTGKSNNGSFSSSDLKDYYADGTVVSGTLSASYTPGTSFNGSATEAGQTVSFTGGPITSGNYNYNSAATLSNITGAWTMTTMQGETVSFNLQSNGAFSATSSGCSFSGTVKPRASGKNVFDVSLQFGGSPCALPNQAASGIAVEYVATNGKRQLILAGTNTSRSAGTAMFGLR